MIAYDAKVYSCGHHIKQGEHLGDLMKNTLEEIWSQRDLSDPKNYVVSCNQQCAPTNMKYNRQTENKLKEKYGNDYLNGVSIMSDEDIKMYLGDLMKRSANLSPVMPVVHLDKNESKELLISQGDFVDPEQSYRLMDVERRRSGWHRFFKKNYESFHLATHGNFVLVQHNAVDHVNAQGDNMGDYEIFYLKPGSKKMITVAYSDAGVGNEMWVPKITQASGYQVDFQHIRNLQLDIQPQQSGNQVILETVWPLIVSCVSLQDLQGKLNRLKSQMQTTWYVFPEEVL